MQNIKAALYSEWVRLQSLNQSTSKQLTNDPITLDHLLAHFCSSITPKVIIRQQQKPFIPAKPHFTIIPPGY